MFKNSRSVAGLLSLALCAGLTLRTSFTAQAQREAEVANPNQAQPQASKNEWTPKKLAAEKWLLHELHQQQLAALPAGEYPRLAADIVLQDVNDISVIQNSNLIARQPNNFDLNGRTLNFTPAGRGYVISNVGSAFDSNLGSKLDLANAPAVNPKAGSQAGDDAYLGQDLGFSFPLFGDGYTIVAIASNGSLTFRNAGTVTDGFNQSTVASESLIDLRTGPPRLAPYWHDLDARPAVTQGANGVYVRRDADRVVITWNNIPDFPNDAQRDKGVHRFQVVLFRDGRISFNYASVQLTSKALVGLSPGGALN